MARRLTVRAAIGLMLLLLACAGAVVAALAALRLVPGLVSAGEWFSAFSLTVAGVLVVWCAAKLASCLFAANPPPVGVPLSRELAPSLHAMVDACARDFDGIRIDCIWITGDINAAVLQRPRMGLHGRMETHLLIGLPLAHSVSERQFGAILAHEFGHLLCQRRAFSAWACHLRAWWFRALDNCIERLPLFGVLLDRLTIGDVMQAQALSRIEEFEADRAAARAVGAPLLAQTLLEVAARERFLRCDYWVKVMAQCADLPRPSVRPYRDMGLGMVAGFLPSDQRGGCLGDQCGGEDGLHPTLTERLDALREMPPLETLVEDSVAERHLGPLLPRLAWELDRAWWSVTRGEWRQVYRRSRSRRMRSIA
jgi:hypothetical protein